MTLVKICGITQIEDAIASAQAGANVLGFVFADSPRRASVETVKHIDRILGGDVRMVGVFTEESDDVLRIMDECHLDFAQLHGNQSEEFARRIGSDRVIRVVRVRDKESIAALERYPTSAYYLFDTYRTGMAGGTGKTFDWDLVAQTPIDKPVILSGGLNPQNVREAIRVVRPAWVDVSSGVEVAPGVKDHKVVKEFIDNVRAEDTDAR